MTTDIVNGIDLRLGQIQVEITKLEDARTALLNGTTAPDRPKPRRPRRRVAAPSSQVVAAGELTTLLTGSKGLTTSELATATNGNHSQILSLLRELESADQVRRTGQRRGTRWHVITDEDRIAARAAELAGQSKRPRAPKS